jgi:glycosyltransferase involved in cell wall biosynthesis
MLRRAFREARARGLEAQLVLAGPGHEAAGHEDGVVMISYVPAERMPALYAGAIALLLPSRFEGFGFPVIEAMSCGTAVVASTAGALPEIVGTAGVLLRPDDAGVWSHAMLELAADPQLQRRLIAAGLGRSAAFSWENASAKTWSVLETAARVGQAASDS